MESASNLKLFISFAEIVRIEDCNAFEDPFAATASQVEVNEIISLKSKRQYKELPSYYLNIYGIMNLSAI